MLILTRRTQKVKRHKELKDLPAKQGPDKAGREIPAVFLKRMEALAWLMPEFADKADLCVLNS
jgi:hypothetical protein